MMVSGPGTVEDLGLGRLVKDVGTWGSGLVGRGSGIDEVRGWRVEAETAGDVS